MNRTFHCFGIKPILIISLSTTLGACSSGSWWSNDEPTLQVEQIKKLIPKYGQDRTSWAQDIYDVSTELDIPQTKENVCSIIAVVDQESNFNADPAVPGLGAKAVKEIDERLNQKFTDSFGEKIGSKMADYFQDTLRNQPSPENNYLSQIKKVKTERQLDELYREIFDYMSSHYHISALTSTAKLFGQDFGEKLNPITTLGSMQVHISYAKDNKRQSGDIAALRTDLYSQYGGLYYGIHRLMMYPADYDQAIYRFADYNSGIYSSRNAAFQKMLNELTDANLTLDGDLLIYDKDGAVRSNQSASENELITLFTRYNVVVTPRQIRADLKKEKEKKFEETATYLNLVKIYEEKTQKKAIYAIMPEVVISGPKLSREYNTNWFASRVNGRYETCMRKAKKIKI